MKSSVWLLAALLLAIPSYAQSPNTAALIVVATDQSGAVVTDARVAVANSETGATRDAVSGADGSATIAALPVTGAYRVTVTKDGFAPETTDALVLRAGETATVRVRLQVGRESAAVTVYGTTEGTRAQPQLGMRLDAQRMNETPILGRKISSLPLLNSTFRPAKGTGDLFVNTTFVVTAAGGRRETTVAVDGATDDEAWSRQTAVIALPIGAVDEMSAMTNAFSAEFGWTAGPALNIVTKSGTNTLHGDGLYLGRPGRWEAKTVSTDGFCPPSVSSCQAPSTLQDVTAPDIPDTLNQFSGSIGGAIVKDKTFFFVTDDYTRQNRTSFLSDRLPSFVLPPNGDLSYVGHYRQELLNARVDHRLSASQTVMVRANIDRFTDTNPQDTVGGTSAPTVARSYARRSWSMQGNYTTIINPRLLNEARFVFLNGDPISTWEPANLSTTYSRSGAVPFTIGQSRVADLFSRQGQFSDTVTWSYGRHTIRLGGSAARHVSGGFGSEFGTAKLGTFTFRNTTTAPFEQLTLADVQQYTQPISFGRSDYRLSQWLLSAYVQDGFRLTNDLTIDAGLRYDRQTITDATKNLEPRIGFGWHPNGDARLAVRGGYGMYYTQIRSNVYAAALTGGLDGLTTYTAVPGQLGFPTCLTGACLPLQFDPRTLSPSQLPARDIALNPGMRAFYDQQFAQYGLNFGLLPDYPDKLLNPRSQFVSVGIEREVSPGLFVSADYVHQHWGNIDRTVDLNAPSAFDRTEPGQRRSVAEANATRPILPVNGGIRQVNVLMNLGTADYDGLQTEIRYRAGSRFNASLSYTLSKATNTTEPDGNGVNPNQSIITRLGEEERGPSLLDQRHRAVVTATYRFAHDITAGTFTQLASARPFSATTGVDNNGDGSNNDRPVINGSVVGRSAFRSTAVYDVALFVEKNFPLSVGSLVLRLEGFNFFNHANILGRAQTVYGDAATPEPTFGQLVSAGSSSTALPSLSNIDPPRMFQFQARYRF